MKIHPILGSLLAAVALAIVPSVHAQSSVANPFGPAVASSAQAAPLSKAQAKAALSRAATAKVNAKFLEQLLDAERGELVLTFHVDRPAGAASPARQLESNRQAIRAARRNVQASLKSLDIAYVHEYTNLPLANVKVKSRAALVQLLNHPGVKSITKPTPTVLHMNESRALIHAPTGVSQNGRNTVVAVIDSGLNFTLPAFGSCAAAGQPGCRVLATQVTTGLTGDTFSTSGSSSEHGTNVAGIIAAMAPEAGIIAVDARPQPGEPMT